jgi:hypothetical protein
MKKIKRPTKINKMKNNKMTTQIKLKNSKKMNNNSPQRKNKKKNSPQKKKNNPQKRKKILIIRSLR